MFPTSSDNVHHDVTTFKVCGMVQNTKTLISQDWAMTFQ